MSIKIFGIDTGLSGAMALIDTEFNVLETYANPILRVDRGTGDNKKTSREYDLQEIKRIFKSLNVKKTIVVIEKTYPRPSTPDYPTQAASNYYLGAGLYAFVGMIVYAGFRHQLVDPRTWQADMFRGLPRTDTKIMAHQVASRLFPDVELKTKRGRILDGLADALCIAEWGRRQLLGKGENV